MDQTKLVPRNKIFFYKNDLKFSNPEDVLDSEFDSEMTEQLYNKHREKPKIELRLEEAHTENYKYLDLSKLGIGDKHLDQLLELPRVTHILKKIEFLDLSNNKLNTMPDISKYPNIIHLDISHNTISGSIKNNTFVELSCTHNKINSIRSSSIERLNASNNNIEHINVPQIVIMIIDNNVLQNIHSYPRLKYLNCVGNQIECIANMDNLEELFVGNNRIIKIMNLPKIIVLNCVNNPIDKIEYFPLLEMLMTSTPVISKKYTVAHTSKFKTDYVFNMRVGSGTGTGPKPKPK